MVPGSGYWDKFKVMMAAKQLPDILRSDDDWVGEYFVRDQFMDLTDLVKKDIDTSKFFKDSWIPFMYKGKIYALPFKGDVVGMYYNNKLFKDDGRLRPEGRDHLRAVPRRGAEDDHAEGRQAVHLRLRDPHAVALPADLDLEGRRQPLRQGQDQVDAERPGGDRGPAGLHRPPQQVPRRPFGFGREGRGLRHAVQGGTPGDVGERQLGPAGLPRLAQGGHPRLRRRHAGQGPGEQPDPRDLRGVVDAVLRAEQDGGLGGHEVAQHRQGASDLPRQHRRASRSSRRSPTRTRSCGPTLPKTSRSSSRSWRRPRASPSSCCRAPRWTRKWNRDVEGLFLGTKTAKEAADTFVKDIQETINNEIQYRPYADVDTVTP